MPQIWLNIVNVDLLVLFGTIFSAVRALHIGSLDEKLRITPIDMWEYSFLILLDIKLAFLLLNVQYFHFLELESVYPWDQLQIVIQLLLPIAHYWWRIFGVFQVQAFSCVCIFVFVIKGFILYLDTKFIRNGRLSSFWWKWPTYWHHDKTTTTKE